MYSTVLVNNFGMRISNWRVGRLYQGILTVLPVCLLTVPESFLTMEEMPLPVSWNRLHRLQNVGAFCHVLEMRRNEHTLTPRSEGRLRGIYACWQFLPDYLLIHLTLLDTIIRYPWRRM